MMMWGWGIVVMVICMAFMWMMMGRGMFGSHSRDSEPQSRDTPERTLENRLASGEIDVDEYQRRREQLHRTRTDGDSARR